MLIESLGFIRFGGFIGFERARRAHWVWRVEFKFWVWKGWDLLVKPVAPDQENMNRFLRSTGFRIWGIKLP